MTDKESNFAKDINVPHKEQMIINGIDVSGCEFYNKDDKTCREVNGKYDTDICEFDKCENHNCYYKQLQREKQNSQEAMDASIREFNRAEELKTLLKRKEQECEELKKTVMYKCPQCGEEYLSPIGASLYEENNNLKEKKAKYYQQTLNDEIQINELLQTLTEIKEIAENMNTECFYNDFDCKYCDMKNGCTYHMKIKILQKISECEMRDDKSNR